MTKVYAVSTVDLYDGQIEAGVLYPVVYEEDGLFLIEDISEEIDEILGIWGSSCAHQVYESGGLGEWKRVEI
ncbi:MAG: hypothetical protein CMF22_10445 [Idiomarinaceae bacterium]|nr:hypothetical protein [Idiomarinaceae bacterium]MBG23860.1 hypothetical protein [Idiomarinaceae bacterium]|tara:strand:- start:16586 stop:16801 length:216 start_codon:yes stop_codon:yes gene_type:complete